MLDGLSSAWRWGPTVAVLIVSLAIAGCGGGSADSVGSGTAPAVRGGTLHLAEVEEVEGFAPTTVTGETSVHMVGQVMEPLIRANTESELEPWLAESYKSSSDHLTWTFRLRKGVDFSNGTPLTAEDVVFSLDAVRKSADWEFMFERIKSVTAPSPDVVVVKLSKPESSLLAELSLYAADIVPKDFGGMTERQFAQNPIGTGPFVLESWKRGQSMTLSRNPHYWRQGEPLLERLVVTTVPSPESRVSQLQNGQLEAILSPTFAQVAQLEATPGTKVGKYAWSLINTVQLSSTSPAFENPKAREAFDLAIDREGIIATAASGLGKPAGSWVPSSVPDWDPNIKPVVQDLAKAKSLLAEAVKAGSDPSFTLLYSAGDPYWTTATQVMQQNLEEVGFQVTLRALDVSAVTEMWLAGEYEAVAWSGGKPDIPDQSEFTGFYVGTDALGTGAPTAKVEQIAEQVRSTFAAQKRRRLYYEFQELVAEEHFFITLDEQQFLWGLKDNISGFDTNLTGKPTLAEAGFSG